MHRNVCFAIVVVCTDAPAKKTQKPKVLDDDGYAIIPQLSKQESTKVNHALVSSD